MRSFSVDPHQDQNKLSQSTTWAHSSEWCGSTEVKIEIFWTERGHWLIFPWNIHQRLIQWQSRPFLCLVCSLCLCLAFSSPKKFNTPYLMCSLCLGSFFNIIYTPYLSCICPVIICLTCLMCLTFSCCVWCGFFLLHLKCLHFLSLKLSPSSSVFDVFNLCFGSFFLKNILHPVFDVFHVFQNFSQKFLTLFSCV